MISGYVCLLSVSYHGLKTRFDFPISTQLVVELGEWNDSDRCPNSSGVSQLRDIPAKVCFHVFKLTMIHIY